MHFFRVQSSSVLPPVLSTRLGNASRLFSLCDYCSSANRSSEPGFKVRSYDLATHSNRKSSIIYFLQVFTFKNPYLGNTCVPFLHWACSRECAEAIEVPARREQVRARNESVR